jgi:hypothetical protein
VSIVDLEGGGALIGCKDRLAAAAFNALGHR